MSPSRTLGASKSSTNTTFHLHWLQQQRKKPFLQQIVTKHERRVHYEGIKRKKSRLDTSQPAVMKPKWCLHGAKTLLHIWWDGKREINQEFLKPSLLDTAHLYQHVMINFRPSLSCERSPVKRWKARVPAKLSWIHPEHTPLTLRSSKK